MDGLGHVAWLGVLAGLAGWLLWTGRRGGPALYFVVLALAATWPLAISLARLPANAPAAEDARLFLWDLWWVRTALLGAESPLHTDLLYAPHGTALVLHGLALPQALATLPIQLVRPGLAGLVAAYGVVVLGSFALAGWAAHRLALRVVGDPAAALVAGTAFTLQSLHFASTVRFHALAIEWLPLVLWVLLRVFEHGRVRDGVALGAAFAGAFYASVEYAYFLLLAGAGLVAFQLVRRRTRAAAHGWWARSAAGAAGTAGLLLLPWLWVFVPETALTHGALADQVRHLTPDVLDLVLPDPRHSLLGGAIGDLREGLGLAPVPTAVAFSWTLLGLAALGTARAVRRGSGEILVWAGIALAFVALMLGPSIRLLGSDTGVPGPYALLARALPFFEQARMPMRLGAVAQLGLAVLAAYGLAGLAARVAADRRWLVAAAAGALVAFEALRVPLETAPVEIPEAYRRVAVTSRVGETALLDWPPGRGAAAEIEGLHQIVHGQKLVQDLPLFLPRAALETRRTATGPELRRFAPVVLGSGRLRAARGPVRARLLAEAEADRRALDLGHVVLRRRELEPEVYRRSRDQLLLLDPAATWEDEDAFLASFAPAPPRRDGS